MRHAKNHYLVLLMILFLSYFNMQKGDLFATEKNVLDDVRLKYAIEKHIEKHMPWQKGAVRISFPFEIPEIELPGAKQTLEVEDNLSDDYVGERLYHVKIRCKNSFYKKVSVKTKIEVCREVVVSSRPLMKDHTLTADDIAIEKRWFNSSPQDLLSDPKYLIGKRVVRSINAKNPLTLNMLSNPILFKRGKIVKIVFDSETVTIVTTGVAEEEGTYGASVRIRNISSNKVIQATVIGESLVKLEL
jgi:flagellar basal body P-ring formation protein FlgA